MTEHKNQLSLESRLKLAADEIARLRSQLE